eukprot:GSMAST32.ASY1.ANO1.1093.1 assembled CDS
MSTSTNSAIQSERIAARQKRVALRQQRANKDSSRNNQLDDYTDTKTSLSRGKQQTADSMVTIDSLKVATLKDVTSVRTDTDDRENRRRIAVEMKREERLQALREEAIRSTEQNEYIEKRWDDLNSLIKQFQLELKAKDEEYVKMLKRQADDMNDTYEKELTSITTAYEEERNEALEDNHEKTNNLFKRRRQMDLEFMAAKLEREERYMKEVESMRVKDSESYQRLKIKLETDIQVLEQQLQEMRATYQLNTEKLEYNYRVLTERDMENTATLAVQKRRLGRLKEQLSTLMLKYKNNDEAYKQRNAELTDEYTRATKQYKDLQKKFRHFQISDNGKFNQLWIMHEEEVREYANKVLTGGKIITEQQLGLHFVPPRKELTVQELAIDSHNSKKTKAAAATSLDNGLGNATKDGEVGRVKAEKIRVMLQMLRNSASFLVPPKLMEKIEVLKKTTPSHELETLKSDAILEALGVTSASETETLLGYFFDNRDMGLKIDEDKVVEVCRLFMENKATEDEAKASDESAAAAAAKQLARSRENQFWEEMANIIPPKSYRVWEALEHSIKDYVKNIEERSQLSNEINSLRSQNAELKSLLNQYLGAEVNAQLQIPPTQMIRLENSSTPEFPKSNGN